MREVALIVEYLQKRRKVHLAVAMKAAAESSTVSDYTQIVSEARIVAEYEEIMRSITLLEADPGKFIEDKLGK